MLERGTLQLVFMAFNQWRDGCLYRIWVSLVV